MKKHENDRYLDLNQACVAESEQLQREGERWGGGGGGAAFVLSLSQTEATH